MIENGFTKISEHYDSHTNLLPALLRKVYTWMALALAITAITAYGVATSPNLLGMMFNNQMIYIGMMIAELVLVVWLSARLNRLSLQTATMMFIGYSILNGATLSVIFLAYAMGTIAQAFLTCALTFAAMSIYGYTTKKDLSRIGSLLIMALLGLIIATVVNMFVRSSGLSVITTYAGVLIFVGLTAWDTQKIKNMLAQTPYADEQTQKLALIGALSLYLDFINLFLYLLRIFGNRRD